MERNLLRKAASFMLEQRRRKRWQKVVSGMAAVVVFCTTYALILPAITMSSDTICGLEEHAHTEECWTTETRYPQSSMACVLNAGGALVVHTHDDACYSEDGTRICTLDELAAHQHGDSCYREKRTLTCLETEDLGHAHSDACYTSVRGDMTCTLAEDAGHSHDDTCYQVSSELICTDQSEGHSHEAGCYTETKTLVCLEEERPGHAHDDSCYAWTKVQTCTEEERPAGHIHSDACYETSQVLNCKQEEVILHTHGDGCYDESGDLTCQVEEVIAHQHTADCIVPAEGEPWEEQVLICKLEVHSHVESCYPQEEQAYVCGLEEHAHGESCYDAQGSLTCSLQEHSHADACLTAEEDRPEYICGYEEHAHSDACCDDEGLLVCGLEAHTHDDTCVAAEYFCGLEEHTHSEKCYDAGGNVTCGLEEHAHTALCALETQPTEAEWDAIQSVIDRIDAMPSADEIDATLAEYEAAEDYEGEEAWYTQVAQQVAEAYYYYDQLIEEHRVLVTNADKLLELEYIWSVTEYVASSGTGHIDTVPIWQVNTYAAQSSGTATVLIYGGSYDEVVGGAATFGSGWTSIVVDTDSSGNLYVKSYDKSSSDKSALKPTDTKNGFVVYINSTIYLDSYGKSGPMYVSININYKTMGKGAYTGTAYGTLTIDDEVFPKKTSAESAAPTVVQSASTSDFIELNLYDYGSNINTLYNKNKYSYTDWNYATKYSSYYPGFQWNGGAYSKLTSNSKTNLRHSYAYQGIGIPYAITDRNAIDSIDFGNSLITDAEYSNSDYGKSDTATDITFFADSGTYNINSMDYYYDVLDLDKDGSTEDERNLYGVNNRPTGLSIANSITSTAYDVLQRTLGSDGYPALEKNGTSLSYLFSQNTYATKQNTATIDGLFQQDDITGEYYFNSRWNHAQYNNNKFTLYEEILTPNFITYPFGNFMPFNDITSSEAATQVSKITSMGNYMDYMIDQMYPYTLSSEYVAGYDATRSQLYTMLLEYKENVDIFGGMYDAVNTSTPRTWSNFDAADAIADYFTQDGDNPSEDIKFLTGKDHLSTLYNIDYDEEKDFFFGMEMKMNFMQPKDGLTGHDNGDNAKGTWSVVANKNGDTLFTDDDTKKLSGDPDGISDYPMVFYFTGDDDVWVYVDDVLFLDLSGIHRHVGGEIDFYNGVVNYYALDVESGDISSKPYATYTFAEILKAAGKSTDGLNSKGTFVDYSTHSFKFYYMERGSGSSVCRINFNFPLLRKNAISVTKELSVDDQSKLELLGNPDFQFQILKANSDGTKTEDLFVTKGTTYRILDNYGNEVGSGTVGDNGVFTLKAGQTAEFAGIKESDGKYYVRELLDANEFAQYGAITVNGQSITTSGSVTIGSTTFQGLESDVKDISNGNTAFSFNNQVTFKKLGKLAVEKKVKDYVAAMALSDPPTFTMNVKLDGVPVPVGTSYDVYNAETGELLRTDTVKTAGQVIIAHGERAVLSNILAGTAFEVTEASESSAGYTVQYQVNGGTASGTAAEGTIQVYEDDTDIVQVLVTNSEQGGYAEIVINKTLINPDSAQRTFTFKVEQQNADGTWTVIEPDVDITMAPDTEQGSESFILTYIDSEMGTLPATYTYRITENAGEVGVVYDESVYLVTVEVSQSVGGLNAEITRVTKDDVELTSETITFVNEVMRYELPETGGGGTGWYTLAGALIMLGAAYLLYRDILRRKEGSASTS